MHRPVKGMMFVRVDGGGTDEFFGCWRLLKGIQGNHRSLFGRAILICQRFDGCSSHGNTEGPPPLGKEHPLSQGSMLVAGRVPPQKKREKTQKGEDRGADSVVSPLFSLLFFRL